MKMGKELNYRCGRGPCPKCGSRRVAMDVSCVLTTYPPQYRYECFDCGHTWTGFETTQIGPITSWPDLEPDVSVESLNYGWICPKCGRVYSPSTGQCLFCGETYSSNIVYCGSNNGTKDILDTITISNTVNSPHTNATIVDMAKNALHEELQNSIKNSKK